MGWKRQILRYPGCRSTKWNCWENVLDPLRYDPRFVEGGRLAWCSNRERSVVPRRGNGGASPELGRKVDGHQYERYWPAGLMRGSEAWSDGATWVRRWAPANFPHPAAGASTSFLLCFRVFEVDLRSGEHTKRCCWTPGPKASPTGRRTCFGVVDRAR